MKYYPHTEDDINKMLAFTGVSSLDDLFSLIPEKFLLKKGFLQTMPGTWEYELRKRIEKDYFGSGRGDTLLFSGGGCYEHFIPSVIDHMASRSEFYTAYTPYQPEASQGTLQMIFEYQSLMCELTGMDVSNASHYDGATALAEAVLMAVRQKKGKVLVSNAVHPRYRQVLQTYLGKKYFSLLEWLPACDGTVDIESVSGAIACLVIQSPNFFGLIENVRSLSERVHSQGGYMLMAANPLSFGLLESPGALGVDISVGEAQPLGLPMCCGGETLGYFCVKKTFMRKIPGRLAGMATDKEGRRGFVLTLQTREQHIRREKATSNICSNQALNALRAACYLSYMGKQGLQKVSERNARNAFYLYNVLQKQGIKMLFPDKPFFNEFVFCIPHAEKFMAFCRERNIIPGIPLKKFFPEYPDAILTCVTETKDADMIDTLAHMIKEYVKNNG